MRMRPRFAAEAISFICPGNCRIAWHCWPTDRTPSRRYRCSPKADGASQRFQYYLLDTNGFEPNVFTAIIPGVNDGNVQLTATGGNCGLPTLGAVRVVLEPKPGLPTDPNNPRA